MKKRYEHHHGFNISDEDGARGELGNTFAVLGSTSPYSLWVLHHIFSDSRVLADIRKEVSVLVNESSDEENKFFVSIDLADSR